MKKRVAGDFIEKRKIQCVRRTSGMTGGSGRVRVSNTSAHFCGAPSSLERKLRLCLVLFIIYLLSCSRHCRSGFCALRNK
jgi:hypothetical protein